ncbi:uncharacterized protein LOC116182351 [Photinus pyralis]|uniref:uncharacterized protein LOC116182351 n=1 Tax=Photinus pyralis TaxID=7054 RepID=UPI0012673B2C|nr:uncharacterized protein LOC116182351 [Photinus pyralis]
MAAHLEGDSEDEDTQQEMESEIDPETETFESEEIPTLTYYFQRRNWRIELLSSNKLQPEECLTDSSVTSVASSVIEAAPSIVPLPDLLNNSAKGKRLLEFYKCKSVLREDHKSDLIEIINEHYINKNQRLSLKLQEYFAEEITKLFPTELKSTYFQKRELGKNPKGKLYNRVRNSYTCLKRKGLLSIQTPKAKGKKTPPNEELPEHSQRNSLDSLDYNSGITDEAEFNCIKSWLKYNTHDHCWDEVLKKWDKTSHGRLKECYSKPTTELFVEWPLYKHGLIETDFKHMYPGKESNLFEKWTIFVNKIHQYFPSHVKDKSGLADIQKLVDVKNDSVSIKHLHISRNISHTLC